MAWIKPAAYVDHGCIVSNYKSVYFQLHSDQKLAGYTYHGPRTGSYLASTYSYSTDTVPLDEWSHVAFTEDKSGMRRFYINGELAGEDQQEATIYPGERYLYIADDDLGAYFNGMIDEIYVFKRALTQRRIQLMYEKGKPWFQ